MSGATTQTRQFERFLKRISELTLRRRERLPTPLRPHLNALSGTPLARLRLNSHWLDYLDRMLDFAQRAPLGDRTRRGQHDHVSLAPSLPHAD